MGKTCGVVFVVSEFAFAGGNSYNNVYTRAFRVLVPVSHSTSGLEKNKECVAMCVCVPVRRRQGMA